jgi:hypothetical protein
MQTEDTSTRYTVVSDKQHHRALAELAKKYKISQGEVIEVFLDHADMDEMEAHFTKRRNEKVDLRSGADKVMIAKIKALTPAQLALIEKMYAENAGNQ